ncbi:unnamed protein product [Linum trigynum]|uniref:Uncharacterized protein n=1 Tax=Linum trigynum TaxID=586398 RepID=A0AAV2DWJ9_9ROSI
MTQSPMPQIYLEVSLQGDPKSLSSKLEEGCTSRKQKGRMRLKPSTTDFNSRPGIMSSTDQGWRMEEPRAAKVQFSDRGTK